mmetsp:Transcript_131503/g.294249  ORF Transcript_131503/g.294249 Transcript_131503/m.294249 type:complete len:205 (-) Transcript_131503:361-975(-)
MLEILEGALTRRQQDQEPDEDEERHAHRDEGLCQVVACMRIVEGEGLGKVKGLPQAEDLACEDLLAGARRQLREEAKYSVEAQVPTFGKVEVFPVMNLSPLASEGKVHACEDVFREVDGLRRLRDPSLLHHVQLVHDVRVAVMHTSAEYRVGTLKDGSKGHLGRSGEVADRPDVAGDVLREADDALRQTVPTGTRTELPKSTWQ